MNSFSSFFILFIYFSFFDIHLTSYSGEVFYTFGGRHLQLFHLILRESQKRGYWKVCRQTKQNIDQETRYQTWRRTSNGEIDDTENWQIQTLAQINERISRLGNEHNKRQSDIPRQTGQPNYRPKGGKVHRLNERQATSQQINRYAQQQTSGFLTSLRTLI